MDSSKDIRHFNEWAPTYENSWVQHYIDGVHQVMLETIGRSTGETPITSVLDLGCGTGRLLRKVRARWPSAQLFGIDPAEGMIREARQLTPAVTFEAGGAESLTFPDRSFDLAMSSLSFHHWKDQGEGMREVSRVLRPGGYFCLSDIVMPRWLTRLMRHGNTQSAASVGDFFVRAGFSVLEQRRIMAKVILVVMGRRMGK